MESDLGDIRPALQVQIVAGMHFDRRVFLIATRETLALAPTSEGPDDHSFL